MQLFQLLLTAVIISLCAMLVCIVMAFPLWLISAPVVLYFAWVQRHCTISSVERKYPQLRDKLRTAIDAEDHESPFVQELQQEISYELAYLNSESFFDRWKTFRKLLIAILLCFALFIIPPLPMSEIIRSATLDAYNTIISGSTRFIGTGTGNAEIYGERSSIIVGDKEVKVIFGTKNYPTTENIYDATTKEFSISSAEQSYSLESTISFQEDIPLEHREIVSRYFRGIAQSGKE